MSDSNLTASSYLLSESDDLKKGIWPRSLALWMAGFYIALFIIQPWDQLLPWLGNIKFERIYTILLLVVAFSAKRKNPINMSTSHTVWVLFYWSAVVISALAAIRPDLAWEPFYVFTTLVLFYFVLISVIRSPYELIFIIICYQLAMTTYLAKAQWEFWVNGQHIYDMGVTRMIGIETMHGSPNSLSMSIVVSLPFTYFLWINRDVVIATWPKLYAKWFPRFLLLSFLLAVSAIVLTNSRSGMVGFILFVAITAFRGKRIGVMIKYVVGALVLLALVWQFMPEENRKRFESTFNPEEGPKSAEVSAEGRIEGFYAGMDMFKRYPITGVGVGNFKTYRVKKLDGVALNAHNIVGQVLGEAGLIGGLCLLFLILVILSNCRRIRKRVKLYIEHKNMKLYSTLAIAITNSILLLAFLGIFGHNAFRYNWLWLAAFSLLMSQFVNVYINELNAKRSNI